MKPIMKAASLAGLVAISAWMARPAPDTAPDKAPDKAPDTAPTNVKHDRQGPSAATAAAQARPSGKMEIFGTLPSAPAPVSAAASLAATRAHGDPESPPIARDAYEREQPNARELTDPKAYQAFEARQTARVYAAYVRAVDQELPRLQNDIARGRAMGIDPEELAKAEEKVRSLKQMRDQLATEIRSAP